MPTPDANAAPAIASTGGRPGTARRVLVSGRVQGVFFRDSCARRAREQGVAGWVRNRADGRVEAWFQGEAQAVENMVTWCRHGPARAEVSDVEVEAVDPAPLNAFRIE
ncbi:MAG: acylphosphatase [Acidimicrobiales bacterium]